MNFPRREIVERLKEQYPAGTMVELISMNDPYREMPAGLTGVVTGVDDCGTVHVNWQNGSSLGVVYGEDFCRKLP